MSNSKVPGRRTDTCVCKKDGFLELLRAGWRQILREYIILHLQGHRPPQRTQIPLLDQPRIQHPCRKPLLSMGLAISPGSPAVLSRHFLLFACGGPGHLFSKSCRIRGRVLFLRCCCFICLLFLLSCHLPSPPLASPALILSSLPTKGSSFC